MTYDFWKTSNPADEELGSTHPDLGPDEPLAFRPGDRVRNKFTTGQYLGTVIDDLDPDQGSVAVTYDFSSQVYYVDPIMLVLISRDGEEVTP